MPSLYLTLSGTCMRGKCSVLYDFFSNKVVMVTANNFEDECMPAMMMTTLYTYLILPIHSCDNSVFFFIIGN